MKTIKLLFAILFLSTMFIACEADAVNEEIGIELNDKFVSEDGEEDVNPSASEDGDEDVNPTTKRSEDGDEDVQPGGSSN